MTTFCRKKGGTITGAIEGNTLVWLIALLVFAGVVLLILFFNYKPQLLGLWENFVGRLVG